MSEVQKMNVESYFISTKTTFLYCSIVLTQLLTSTVAASCLSSEKVRTGAAQTFAAVGFSLLACDVLADFTARYARVSRGVYFPFAFSTTVLGLSAVLCLACNTEDSVESSVNKDELALCFGVCGWGCQFARVVANFAQLESGAQEVYKVRLSELAVQ